VTVLENLAAIVDDPVARGARLPDQASTDTAPSTSASFATSPSPLTARAPSFAPNRDREKEFREKGIRRVDVGQQPQRRLDRVSRIGAPAGRPAGTARWRLARARESDEEVNAGMDRRDRAVLDHANDRLAL